MQETRFHLEHSLHSLVVLLAAFGGLLLSCQTPPESAPPESAQLWESSRATPPLFEVDGGEGARLILLGTIHLGPPGGWSFPDEIDQDLSRAASFVFEVDTRELTEENTSQALMRHGLLPGDTPLSTLIGPRTARLIQENESLLSENGLPGPVREAVEPWFIAIMLMESAISRTEYSTTEAVEEKILAQIGDRELVGLETLDQQLAFLGDLPLEVQEIVLQDTLMRWESLPSSTTELVEAWRDDDRPALLAMAREGVEELPGLNAFFDLLIDGRNRSWVPELIRLLEDPGRANSSIVVAVGALHLVGPVSVPSLLRDAGYRVRSVSTAKPGSVRIP